MTLHGIDISHYQAGLSLSGADFAIMKATQGTGFVDNKCDSFYQQAKSKKILRGVYHFADGGDVNAEADHFLRNIGGYVGDGILVLDWEGSAVNRGPGWAKQWLDRVHAKTGVKPLIYMNHATNTGSNWSSVVAADYGLWYARYSSSMGSVSYWPHVAMWQYTDRLSFNGQHVDGDEFYGDANTWAAYAGSSSVTPTPTPTPDTDDEDDDMSQRYYGSDTHPKHLTVNKFVPVAPLLSSKGHMVGVARVQISHLGTAPTEVHIGYQETDPDGNVKGEFAAGQHVNQSGDGWFAVPFSIINDTGGVIHLTVKTFVDGATYQQAQISGRRWAE